MRVVVLYNDDAALLHGVPEDRAALQGVVSCAAAVHRACLALGAEAELRRATRDPQALARAVTGADVVFNLVEALDGDARLEAAAAAVLELVGVPYTGSPPAALMLALDKPTAKAVLAHAGVRVAKGTVLTSATDPLPDLPPPWIVKPSREDASHGIDQGSVVHDAEAARARAGLLVETYRQPALVEELLPGRELNLALLGPEPALLSPAEIDFSALPGGHPSILTYEAKWVEASPVFEKTPSVAARDLGPDLEGALGHIARRAFRALGLRDYGRVDIRLDRDGQPVVLEVNPNPDLSPDAGFARAAARSGLSYAELIGQIIDTARRRGPARPLAG